MTDESTSDDGARLQAEEAFAVVGNETRIQILQALDRADEPQTFTELRNAVGYEDPGNFQYHLDKLRGHFVRKIDDGYSLHQPGQRIVEAIRSGAVTGSPEIDATPVDAPCIHCGGETELRYREERLLWRCTECPGSFADADATSEAFGTLPPGSIGLPYLPAAGTEDRTPREMLEASDVWSGTERLAMTYGVCPRCSGSVENALTPCDAHQGPEAVCDECGTRLGLNVESECRVCGHAKTGTLVLQLLGDPLFRSAFDSRGVDVISTPPEDQPAFFPINREVVAMEPFEARLTYEINGEVVTLVVDDDLRVSEVLEGPAAADVPGE